MVSKRVVLFAIAVLLLASLLAYSQLRPVPVVVSGTIEADEIRIGSLVGGRVEKVLVEEGAETEPQQVLIELDAYDLLQRKAEAESNLAAAEAERARLEAGFRAEEVAQAQALVEQLAARLKLLETGPREQEIVAAKARLDGAMAEYKLAQANYDRQREVFKSGATTEERMDMATEALNAAQSLQTVRQQELGLLEAGTREEEIAEAKAKLSEAQALLKLRETGYRKEEIDAARATAAAAKSVLEAIERQLAETKIRAPAQGYVEALDLQPGDLVSPRAPVLSIMDTNHLWIRTYVPLNLHGVQVGQELPIKIDSYPNERFTGKVTFISRDPEFTPSNAQTPEDRAKQVFRVKLSIDNNSGKLRPGMTGVVVLEE